MTSWVSAQPSAVLDVRLLPWRPRLRVMKPDTMREGALEFGDASTMADSIEGFVFGLLFSILFIVFVLVAAPVLVFVLAGLLFSLELPLIILLGVVLPAARFLGVIPWSVLILDPVTGEETAERYRLVWNAVRRVREVNHDRRVRVRWAWA